MAVLKALEIKIVASQITKIIMEIFINLLSVLLVAFFISSRGFWKKEMKNPFASFISPFRF